MHRRRLLLGAIAAMGFGAARKTRAQTGRRVALVIGNADYRYVPHLINPGHDARLIATTLSGLGFALVGGGPQLDLDKARFDQALEEFGRAISGAQVALFYYSGHGMQVDGANWLVPISANPTRVQDLDFQMVNADLILRQTQDAGTRLNIVILDACRNNPFSGRGIRGIGGGLAQMQAPPATLISFATQPGNVALDGTGRDSPYSAALAATLRQPGLDLFRTFNQVGLLVEQATGGAQQPWVSASPIGGEFYFAGNVPGAPPPPLASAVVPAMVQPRRDLAQFDGSYSGRAPGEGGYGCGPVDIAITVVGGRVTGTAAIAIGRRGGEASTVVGRVDSDGSTVLLLQRSSADGPGAPVPGRFVAGRFQGTMGGKIPSCQREVILTRN